MKLPFDILKKFAKEVSKKEDTEKISTFYGVVDSKNGDEVTVKLDGSDISTPVECTMDVEENDRVMVQIKDHKVVVIGNSTSPASARTANAYMRLMDDGLVIGQIDDSSAPMYLFLSGDAYYIKQQSIDPETGDILPINPSTDITMATFRKNRVYLGDSEESVIAFCNDKAKIRYISNETSDIYGAVQISGDYVVLSAEQKDIPYDYSSNVALRGSGYYNLPDDFDWEEYKKQRQNYKYDPEDYYSTGHILLKSDGSFGKAENYTLLDLAAPDYKHGEVIRLISENIIASIRDVIFDFCVNIGKDHPMCDISSKHFNYITFNNSKIATAANLFPLLDTIHSITKTATIKSYKDGTVTSDPITVPSGYTLYNVRSIANDHPGECSLTQWGVDMTNKTCWAGLYNHTGKSVTVTLTFYYLLIRNTI